MLDLRRLRLLRELYERGTIAAVADALQFTPSAVSQQLALLEREAGVQLLERAGRGVRLTDAALMLVEHADALLDRAALAEADLAAAAGTVAGRGRIAAFQSVMLLIALPAIETLATEAPRLRCEVVESEPEESLPALALGDIDLVLGDEWQDQPRRLPEGTQRHDLHRDPVNIVLPARHPAIRHRKAVPLAELAGDTWTTGHAGTGWEEMTERTCRELGGFDPDIRHRANDANVCLALVARGLAVALLPDLPLHLGPNPGVAVRPIAEQPIHRAIFAATRATDAKRPSTQALVRAVRTAAESLPRR